MTDAANDHATEVAGVIARLIHAIDLRQWSEAGGLLADEVVTDYTSLFGGEIQRQRGVDLVAAWRTLLTPLDSTQHLLGPIDVRSSNAGAVASCHVRGYHVRKGPPGGDEWMVAGHYRFEVGRTNGMWRITSITLHTFYETGNLMLLRQTAAG
jgi:hypothetical protein